MSMFESEKSILEFWAKGIDKHSDSELDSDPNYYRVDESISICYPCNDRPRAWLSKKKDVGILRWCNFGIVIVTPDTEKEPVTISSLERVFGRILSRGSGVKS